MSSDSLEELDLLAGGQGHDGLAPGSGPADDAPALGSAPLFLALRREHVDRHDGHVLLGEQLLDRCLDLDLVGIVMDGERVLATAALVHRLLADDRAEDHLVGGERHAYTSSIRASAGCSMSTVSAR